MDFTDTKCTTGDELRDAIKQNEVERLTRYIDSVLEHGEEGTLLTTDLFDLTLDDIEYSLEEMVHGQNHKKKIRGFRKVTDVDIDSKVLISNRIGAYDIKNVDVYFIERDDWVAAISAVEIGKNMTSCLVESLGLESPEYLKTLYNNAEKSKKKDIRELRNIYNWKNLKK
ncbi:MAG TPA: hypothetical protein VJY47_01635 [Candidatus Dojkabacteria bacterium]|nr:hypothetical protein [Candidatus Dojkabacteria bacterium]